MPHEAFTLHSFLLNQHLAETIATCLLISITAIIYSSRHYLKAVSLRKTPVPQSHGASVHKTQILRCSISHRRIFPKRHHFRYSYLAVGLPVRSPTSTWLLSVDSTNRLTRGWLHVTATDHLYRGAKGKNLTQNLDAYLRQEVALSLYVNFMERLTDLDRDSIRRRSQMSILSHPRVSSITNSARHRSGICITQI